MSFKRPTQVASQLELPPSLPCVRTANVWCPWGHSGIFRDIWDNSRGIRDISRGISDISRVIRDFSIFATWWEFLFSILDAEVILFGFMTVMEEGRNMSILIYRWIMDGSNVIWGNRNFVYVQAYGEVNLIFVSVSTRTGAVRTLVLETYKRKFKKNSSRFWVDTELSSGYNFISARKIFRVFSSEQKIAFEFLEKNI